MPRVPVPFKLKRHNLPVQVIATTEVELEEAPAETTAEGRTYSALVIDMRVNCNMNSLTLEKLLSSRWRQVQDMMKIVTKDFQQTCMDADMLRREEARNTLQTKILETARAEDFNEWTQSAEHDDPRDPTAAAWFRGSDFGTASS